MPDTINPGVRAKVVTDLVMAGYLLATMIPIFGARSQIDHAWILLAAHLAGAVLLIRLGRWQEPKSPAPRFFRDWYPVFLFPVLYKEVELLAAAVGNWSLTPVVMRVEERLFAGQPAVYLAEVFAWLPLSEYLHVCYFAYLLLLPVIGGIWYFRDRRPAFDHLILVVSVIYAVSFLFYIAFPVDSPFYRVASPGEPLSSGPVFQLVHFFAERGGARGGAFPSTHVAISTGIWLVCWRWDRRLARALLLIVPGLYVATVYGRFHYALDVFTGWLVAFSVFFAVAWLTKDSGRAAVDAGQSIR